MLTPTLALAKNNEWHVLIRKKADYRFVPVPCSCSGKLHRGLVSGSEATCQQSAIVTKLIALIGTHIQAATHAVEEGSQPL